VVRIDDVVTELELDVLDRTVRQVLQQLLFDGFGNDVLLGWRRRWPATRLRRRAATNYVCK
jgi:hypothetical protein